LLRPTILVLGLAPAPPAARTPSAYAFDDDDDDISCFIDDQCKANACRMTYAPRFFVIL